MNVDHALVISAARCALGTMQVFVGNPVTPDIASTDLPEDVRVAFRVGMATQSLVQATVDVLAARTTAGSPAADYKTADLVVLLRSVARECERLAGDASEHADEAAFAALREALAGMR